MPGLKIAGRGAGLAVLALLCLLMSPIGTASAAPETSPPQVMIVVLPEGTTPNDLTDLDHTAIGLMNPGLGDVSAQQTWLDVSQGARAFDTVYDKALDKLYPSGGSTVGWEKAVDRAKSAENTLIPGLLATDLARHGIRAVAAESAGAAALAVADRDGEIRRPPIACGGPRSMVEPGTRGAEATIPGCPDPVTVLSMPLVEARELAERRREGQLMIFVERPPADSGDQLAIAIAGPGFDGMLQSPSTRTDGYVLSTDIAPTVLHLFGIKAPKAMTGLPIESGGEVDLEGLNSLEGRYEQVGKRRGAALAIPLLLWIALTGLVCLISRGLYARPALRLLCLSTVLLPAVLLLTAALSPSLGVERTIATLLPVLIAAGLMRFLSAPMSLAVACGLTVIPYGIDMLAGSVLTPRAVIGPNPGLGARFYGIGNELESTLMILTSVGTGAALTQFKVAGRRAAIVFLVVGLVATVVFAAGRFGADVGAAIVFPVAAVVAAAIVVGRPRLAWAGLAAALVALALVALADVISGSETHFVRSIVGGSGGGPIDVVGHRLDATLESFTRVSRVPVTVAALIAIGLGVWKRDRIRSWLGPLPVLAAGVQAAAAGSLVGALTNDSGALFIQVGTLYLALVLGFAWTMTRRDGS
ncbi:MAG: hypothetical protein J0H98_01650 [Solirubrobacterales bacterium]|nr:hypothetical protein [Solirubrobacterales bacterium]